MHIDISALRMIEADKGIPIDTVIETIETALLTAYKHTAHPAQHARIDINRKSPELFWLAWSKGEIDLPYHPCSLSQAYRGYLKWCQRTGDRFPFKQNMFTRTLLRIAETCDMPLREKVMAPRNALGVKKSERMLLMVDPPEQDQGTWAGECRESFETALRSYMGEGFPRPPGAGSTGEDE